MNRVILTLSFHLLNTLAFKRITLQICPFLIDKYGYSKLIFKLIIILGIIGVAAALVEFATDKEFWDAVPTHEEGDIFDHYERQ